MATASRIAIKTMRQLGDLQGAVDAQEVRLMQLEQNVESVLKGLEQIKEILRAPEPHPQPDAPGAKPRRRARPQQKEGAA